MRIGPYEIEAGVILAPMAGVTDLPFRALCKSLGAEMVVGEMTASDPSLRDTRKSRLRRIHQDEPLPRAIQILGWDPGMMAEAAAWNVEQGASIIDINMGCPAKKVCKKAAGSALMADEDQVEKILKAVVAAVNVPVTLKTRTGISPDKKNGVRIAQIAEQAGIAMVSVHGRTRSCMYKGQAEYDTIKKVKQSVSIPVIANGDITSVETARRVLDYTQADGVMIGRGAHGQPWLPGLIAKSLTHNVTLRSPDLPMQLNIVITHLRSIHEYYGEYQGVRIARKHIKWYLSRFENSREFISLINQSESGESQIDQVSQFYNLMCNSNITQSIHSVAA